MSRSASVSFCLVRVATACAPAGLWARTARATSTSDDPYDLPDAPRSIELPELTHPDVEWTSVSSIGGVAKTDPLKGGHTTPAFTQRIAPEVPIASRRWFAGATYEFAGGTPVRSRGPACLVGGHVA